MASLHTKRYEVAIWWGPAAPHDLPDVRREVDALTPIGAVIAVLSAASSSFAQEVLVSALDYDVGDWLFNVRLEQGRLFWTS